MPIVAVNVIIVIMTIWLPHLSDLPGPRYQAIADALARDIAAGQLKPGDRLPTHRDLAWHLEVTVGTVSRAYAEAERRGLTYGEVGRGTYVQGPPQARNQVLESGGELESGFVNLDFAGPAPGARDGLIATALRDLADDPNCLDYVGYQPLGGSLRHRMAAVRWLGLRDLSVSEDQVTLTAGAQHGILVALSALTRSGDRVATEALTYPGVQPVARALGLRLAGVDSDDRGLCPAALDALCRTQEIRALYCVPTLHNPTSRTMPLSRRREIVSVAREHGVAIVEDDVFGHLLDRPPPPLFNLAPELVYFLSSLSKSVAPGLRIGFLATSPAAAPKVAAAVRGQCWMAAPVTAEIGARMIENGNAAAILAGRRREASARAALCHEILGDWQLDCEAGALYGWLLLPDPWRANDFAAAAEGRGVKVTPAESFAVERRETPHAVRLCLGPPASRQELRTGLEVLDGLLREGPLGQFEAV